MKYAVNTHLRRFIGMFRMVNTSAWSCRLVPLSRQISGLFFTVLSVFCVYTVGPLLGETRDVVT